MLFIQRLQGTWLSIVTKGVNLLLQKWPVGMFSVGQRCFSHFICLYLIMYVCILGELQVVNKGWSKDKTDFLFFFFLIWQDYHLMVGIIMPVCKNGPVLSKSIFCLAEIQMFNKEHIHPYSGSGDDVHNDIIHGGQRWRYFKDHKCKLCFVCVSNHACCRLACYIHSHIFSRPSNSVYQTQQVPKNVTISSFHHCPPLNLLSVICMATARSVLLFPQFFHPLFERGCWCESNFWSTLEVAGEFRPAAPLLCST